MDHSSYDDFTPDHSHHADVSHSHLTHYSTPSDHLSHDTLIHTDGFHSFYPDHEVHVEHWGAPFSLGQNFDPTQHHDDIVGEPGHDMAYWHQQTHPDTCAVVAQEFVLEELTGHSFSEDALQQEAWQHGLYNRGGTPPEAVGGLLALHGIHVEREYNASFEELQHQLQQHHKVIVGVNAQELCNPNNNANLPLSQTGLTPGAGANHAVQVIGYDPHTHEVILNDPGSPNGCGSRVADNVFLHSWATSGNFMVHTVDSSNAAASFSNQPGSSFFQVPNGVHQPALAGYYNADGTYHYSSDNTDRDAQTGAIIRRY